jgi:hypothetical protein
MNYEIHSQDYPGKKAVIGLECFGAEITAYGEKILCGTIIGQTLMHEVLSSIHDLGMT